MLNKRISTLALASLFMVGVSACDTGEDAGPGNGINGDVNANNGGEDQGEADAKAKDEASEKSDKAEKSEDNEEPSPGKMARDLADNDQNYCAFFVGECLHNTQRCKENTDGSKCDASFESCRDAMIEDACDTGDKLELKTEHALSCWNDFSACALSGTSDAGNCSDALTKCITSALDCDKSGTCPAASWPKQKSKAWPAQGCTCAEQNATRGYFKDKHGRLWYRDRYGRWYYRDRYGRWRLHGKSGGSGGSWGGGGGKWGGGGGKWGGGSWGGGGWGGG